MKIPRRHLATCSLFLAVRLVAAPPAADGEIPGLVRDLGSRNWPMRETAERRLTEIGDPAITALKEAARTGDLEMKTRAEALIERMDRGPAETRVRVDRLVKTLMTTRDVKEGAQAYRELKNVEKYGAKALRELFPARNGTGTVRVDLLLEKRTFRVGEKIPCKRIITNEGAGPVWVRPKDVVHNFSDPDANSTGIFVPGGVQEESHEVLYLQPKASHEETFDLGPMPLGEHTFKVGSLDMNDARMVRHAVAQETKDDEPEFRLSSLLDEIAGLPRPSLLTFQGPAHRIFVIPDLETKGGPLSITVSGPDEVGESRPVEFRIQARGERADPFPLVRLASGTPYDGFWAALIDATGEAVSMATYGEANRLCRELDKDQSDTPELIKLKKGETLQMKGTLSGALPPGDYRLVAGYCRGSDPWGDPGEPFVPPEVAAWKGSVVSDMFPVRIRKETR